MSTTYKRQRTSDCVSGVTTPIPFSRAEKWILQDSSGEDDSITQMAVNNEGGFLYLLRVTNPYACDCGPVVKQVVCASTTSQMVKILEDSIPEFKVFPPGLLPIIGAYIDAEGETRWERVISMRTPHQPYIVTDSVSGYLVCWFHQLPTIIKLASNGTINYIAQIKTKTSRVVFFSWLTLVSGTCMIVEEHRTTCIYELEWKDDTYYIPHEISINLPSTIFFPVYSFVMDENNIYVLDAFVIHSISREPPYRHVPLFKKPIGKKILRRPLVWCGKRHILFALLDDTPASGNKEERHVSLHIIHSGSGQHSCLVTDIPVDEMAYKLVHFCVAHRLARGPCILIRSPSEFRTVPLPPFIVL